MANSRIVSGGTWAQSTTAGFAGIVSGSLGSTVNTTESNAEVKWESGGVFSNLLANCSTHTSNTVITIRDNAGGTATTETVTLAGTGIVEDTTHTDTVTAGHTYDYEFSALASTISVMANTFNATTNTVCRVGQNIWSGGAATTTARFQTICGSCKFSDSTEGNDTKTNMEKAGTVKNLCIIVTAQTTTAAYVSRHNAGAGALTVTLNATGTFEDTTNQDVIVAGDTWDTSSNGWAGTLTTIAVDFISTNGDSLGGNSQANSSLGSQAATTFESIAGAFPLTAITTEARQQITARDAYKLNHLTIAIQAVTTSVTAQSRINLGNGNQIATSTTTGVVIDSTNTDTVTAAQDIDLTITTGSSYTVSQIYEWLNLGGAVVTTTIYPNFFSTAGQRPGPSTLIPHPRPSPGEIGNAPPMFTTY